MERDKQRAGQMDREQHFMWTQNGPHKNMNFGPIIFIILTIWLSASTNESL